MITRLLGWLRFGESSDGDSGGTVWDAIPSWQYRGRHVDSGGVTRDEQERALGEVQRHAEELEKQSEAFDNRP
ncbi:hypothetical protein [Halorussus pelagicus]|uniref:hypothetical protein n=1 Tax=Halorussus pelagicus TaxID=2505977 RepID=UPI000FFCC2CE|nr:hypothetical protein [Halorussus pelagicus]